MPRQLDLTASDPNGRIVPTALHSEMQRSYLEYAMSVIVGRALPDVRDGLKPVHRRILYAMHELGLAPDRPYRKCARVVGDVLGKYHPHGDTAVYDALVRLVQDFSTRYPLLSGHGNFGSIDNDPAAAMRYTECRLSPLGADVLLSEVDEQTVDYTDNFDGSQREPVVLPARLPILLLNGSAGIAVGMATNVPPHNLGELIDGLIALIDDPQISDEALLALVPGPDFPTGGVIVGTGGIRDTYLNGRGSIALRGVCAYEEVGSGRRRRPALVVTELPFQVNKAAWIEKVAELVNAGKIVGISDIRDESSREGVRVVLELKRETRPDPVLAALYRLTPLQTNFGAILLTLVEGQPRLVGLRGLFEQFIAFRTETLTRRIRYNLDQASTRAHQLEGQRIALANLRAVVNLLTEARDATQARTELRERFDLSEQQAEEILKMPLRRLTQLDRERLGAEVAELKERIVELQSLLESRRKLMNLLKRELRDLKKKYADPRRTRIEAQAAPLATPEEATEDAPQLVQLTQRGYVRRVRLEGRRRASTRVEGNDFIVETHTARSRHELLAITRSGRAYSLEVGEIPESGPRSRGTPLVTLLSVPGEQLAATFVREDYPEDLFLVMLTRAGRIKKLPLSECASITARGLIVIKLADDDALAQVALATATSGLVIATSAGRLLRFAANEAQLPTMGRTAVGLQAVKLRKDETALGFAVVNPDSELLVVSRAGIAKRLGVSELSLKERGDLPVPLSLTRDRNDPLVALLAVAPDDELIFLTDQERVLRLGAAVVSLGDRSALGARLGELQPDEKIVVVARGDSDSDDNEG